MKMKLILFNTLVTILHNYFMGIPSELIRKKVDKLLRTLDDVEA